MNWNLQHGVHPDADQLSVFVEGAATTHEREKMLAHLGECAECRKAVFLMQPHQGTHRAAATSEKGWVWRWLVPVGLPAAAVACALIAVLVYIRPHGSSETPQQVASVRPPETERPGTTAAPSSNVEQAAPTTNADREASLNSEQVARSTGGQNGLAAKAATHLSRQENETARGLNLPTSKTGQATVAPKITAPTPSAPAPAAQGADSALAQSTITPGAVSNLPLNGRNFTELQQLQPADTKGAASQNALARKKEPSALQIQAASAQNDALAGISGRITDRTGAVIAGVTVTLRDATGKTRQSTTGTDGSFHLTQLSAGQYELTATASGFKTSQQSIELKPRELALLQSVLDVGSVSEVVEVEAGATTIQTESANVSAEKSSVHRRSTPPSDLPLLATVSRGTRFLSLDNAGNLFLSRNGGKKWKKVKPQWAGKAIRIALTSRSVSEAAPKPKDETSGAASQAAVFLLTTDGGTVWSSEDGAHWHQK